MIIKTMKTTASTVLSLIVLVVLFPCHGGAAPVITVTNPVEYAIEISHFGLPGETHGIEMNACLNRWTLISGMDEDLPGYFRFLDPLALFEPAAFYRVGAGESPAVLAWMNSYPITPGEGGEWDAFPSFRWLPVPVAGATYRFELFETFPNAAGGRVPLAGPILRAGGLRVPSYSLPAGHPEIRPGIAYAWRVTAVTAQRDIRGRPVIGTGFGIQRAGVGGLLLPAPLVAALETEPQPFASTNWGTLLEHLNKLARQKAMIAHAIAGNPLVEEIALIKQLAALLKDPSGITNILSGLLENPASLADPEATLKGLCYLDALLEFVTLYDDGMKPSTKKALKKLKERIEELKKRLEQAADRQSELPKIIEDLKGIQEEFKNEAGNPVSYILRLVRDKLIEKLEKILAKKLADENAAAAIVSIISDLVNFGDLVVQLLRLESICTEYNRTLLTGIARDPTGQTTPGGYVFANLDPKKLTNTTVTIAPKKMCWVRKPGGGPNDGEWVVSDVHFSDGTSTKTVPASTHATDPSNPGYIQIPFTLDPASLSCPPGQGPCIVFVEITINCPGADPAIVNLFKGVIRCP